MADLLDFKNQGNFDFFNVSSYYGDQQRFKSALKADCEKVLEYTHKTMQDMCMLGYQLKELKESGRWQWVKNPETGDCFEGGEFTKFSKYAFGFSETKTSDLLRISKFLQVRGTNEVYLPERYKDYKTSQLTELASVEDGERHHFSPEMTVEEMRLVKKYLESLDCWNERRAAKIAGREFEALAYAQAWKAREDEKKNKPQLPEGVLPGQTSIEDFTGTSNVEQDDDDELEEEEENPTSDLADESDEDENEEVNAEVSEYEREAAIKTALTRDERKRIEIYRKYKTNPLHSEFVDFIKGIYGTSGSFVGELDVNCTSKGLTVTKHTSNFKEIFTVLLSWAEVTQRIVSLINNGEYLSPTELYLADLRAKKEIENGYEAEREEIESDFGRSFAEEEARETFGAEDDEDYAEPPEGGCYQGGGLDYDFDDDIGCDFRADKYNFKTRAGVREFLHDYQNWEKKVGFLGCFFKNTYQYRFRNGTSLWGVTLQMIDKVDGNLQSVEAPQFYIWEDETKNASLISQTQIEQYCAQHKDEL